MKATMYTRTSSAANVDGDSKERQQLAIMAYADSNGINVVAQASDDAVSGADHIGSRKGLGRLIEYCRVNEDVKQILVEDARRFSRDQVIQEMGYIELRKAGIEILCVDAPGYFTLDPTPSQTMIRQIMGAVAQFEKDSLVLKLRGARDRIRATGKKCEGRKTLSEYYKKDIAKLAKSLYNYHRNFAKVSRVLADRGIVQPTSGKPLDRSQVRTLCA